MSDKNPTYLKDENGFCYAYTALLAKESRLTPYDGEVDANGMACESKPAKPSKPAAKPAE